MSVANGQDGKALVLAAFDIIELVGQTVKLKRVGSKFKGLCPFHQEKTPSFTVDPAKQYYHCFGCKAGGNSIDFVMKRDRLDFVDALNQMARQAGIDLPRAGGSKQNFSERQLLLESQSVACGLFEKSLAHPQLGEAAREYLAGRGFTPETLTTFQVGFAPAGWDFLTRNPAMKKFPPALLVTAGLVKPREGGVYDTFRNRIMFPIRDEQGRIIAFGGRVMPGSDDPAKYLNSPETPLFSKSRTAYGLDHGRQKIVETETVAVVEGYTDVVMAHQYGATNVVSVLGTALTPQHVGLLRRFAKRIVLLFDADTAGDLAVNRAVELFLTQPIEIAIASMPDGVDPDEYLIANGAEAFDKLLAEAQDALSFTWGRLRKQFEGNDLTSQQESVEQYLNLLGQARGTGQIDPMRWGGILARVSRMTEMPLEQLNRRFRNSSKKAPSRTVAPAEQFDDSSLVVEHRQLNAGDRAERWMLGVLLVEPHRWASVQQFVGPEDFRDSNRKELASIYWNHQRDEGEPAFSEMLALLQDTRLKELAVELVEEIEQMTELDQTLSDALAHLKSARQRQDQNKLMAELRRTSDATKPDESDDLLRRLSDRARQPDIRRTAT